MQQHDNKLSSDLKRGGLCMDKKKMAHFLYLYIFYIMAV